MKASWNSRSELQRLGDLLAGPGIPWAIAAGAAVFLYTGNRPPTDLDILVRPADLKLAGQYLGARPETKTAPWGEVRKLDLGPVEVVGTLEIRIGGMRCSYWMDDEMERHLRSLPFEGLPVPVLAPEDLVALKAALQRGPEQGKHDLEDIAALAAQVQIDPEYLRLRLRLMESEERAGPILKQWGWA